MRRSIYASMRLLALVTILLTALLLAVVFFTSFYAQMRAKIRNEADYLAAALQASAHKEALLESLRPGDDHTRITWVGADGSVWFDNEADEHHMGNHLDRPEIAQALQYGRAQSVRLSSTLSTQTFYYAIRLDDGSVIRLANTTQSVFATMLRVLPLVLLIAGVMLGLSMLLARRMTRRIVEPINALNLEHPTGNRAAYEELSPLLHRIERQNRQIQKQFEALRVRQEEFIAITQNMTEGLVLVDAQANILTVNRSALALLGAKELDYQGKNILTLTRRRAVRKTVNTALEGRRSSEIITADEHSYRVFASPVLQKGSVCGAILLILDMTEYQRTERMRREFTANVSHELKTPLTSISGYSQLIQNGMVQAGDIPAFAGKIYTEATHMITLVEDIIKLSRLDERAVPLPRETVHLHAAAADVLERLAPLARERDVRLALTGDDGQIFAVRSLIGELLYNLCENAIKYNKSGGSVQVAIRKGQDSVLLEVADTGIGIPQQHQSRIFERFYRVDSSHSRQSGGTGLGLAIAKHIAEYHNARLSLRSAAGTGTSITVAFPLA